MSVPDNAVLSRRRFCSLAIASPLARGITTAAPPAATPKASAEALHTQGVRLLRRGLRFERAAEYFTLAARNDPENPAHPLALACAYASRAAALGYAAGFALRLEAMHDSFAEVVREWEQERDEARAENPRAFNAADFEKTRPMLPPRREFRIKDDSQPFRLTRDQTENRLNDLTARTLAAFETGVSLSRTSEERARAQYLQSWAMRILGFYLGKESGGEESVLPFVIKNLPTRAQVIDASEKAVLAAPGNPLYWQARGDALGDGDAANAAYLKAAELKPRDAANLWYLLYSRAAAGTALKDSEKWSIARSYLERAQARDKGNAWPLYEEAGILFRYAPYSATGPSGNRDASEKEKEVLRQAVRNDASRRNGRRAIDRIVEGNRAPRYTLPLYETSVPDLLRVVWHYQFPSIPGIDGWGRIRELARSASDYAQFMAEFEKQPAEAKRAARAAIGLGQRMIGDWPTKDDLPAGKTVIEVLVGIAVVGIGYAALEKVFGTLGDPDHQTAVKAEYEMFKQRATAHREAVMASLSTPQNEFDAY